MINEQNILREKYISIEDQKYFFVSHEQKRYVIPDRCPHKGAPLQEPVDLKLLDNRWII